MPAQPDPGASAGLLVGRAESWGLTAGSRAPRAGVGLLVIGAWAHLVVALLLVYWWVSCDDRLWGYGCVCS